MGENTDEMKGKTKEATGAATGDQDPKHEGKVDQAGAAIKGAVEDVKGKIEEGIGKVKEKLHRRHES